MGHVRFVQTSLIVRLSTRFGFGLPLLRFLALRKRPLLRDALLCIGLGFFLAALIFKLRVPARQIDAVIKPDAG